MSSDRPAATHAPWAEGGVGAPPPVRIKRLRVPAWIATVMLGACALGSAWSVYLGVRLYDFAHDMSAYGWSAASERRAASLDSMAVVVAVLMVALLLAAAAAFIVWFYRCRFNAGVFQPDANRMGQGWSVGAWFVPVGNLWLPKKMANDMWRAVPPGGHPQSKALLNLWWGLWVGSVALERVASNMYETAVQLDEISRAAAAGIAVDVLFIAAAAAAIAVVWRLTGMQEASAAQLWTPMRGQEDAWLPPGPQQPAPH